MLMLCSVQPLHYTLFFVCKTAVDLEHLTRPLIDGNQRSKTNFAACGNLTSVLSYKVNIVTTVLRFSLITINKWHHP